jgi:hypothetical protein
VVTGVLQQQAPLLQLRLLLLRLPQLPGSFLRLLLRLLGCLMQKLLLLPRLGREFEQQRHCIGRHTLQPQDTLPCYGVCRRHICINCFKCSSPDRKQLFGVCIFGHPFGYIFGALQQV